MLFTTHLDVEDGAGHKHTFWDERGKQIKHGGHVVTRQLT